MEKDKISRVEYEDPGHEHDETNYDEMSPPCDACGEENVGMGTPVIMMIPGMLFPSREYDVPVFVPDPDVKLRTLQFPNNSIGFVTDSEKTKYVHDECYNGLIENAAYIEEREDDEEELDEDEDGQ